MIRARILLFAAAAAALPPLCLLFILHILYPSLHSEYRLKDLGSGFRQVEMERVNLFTNVNGDEAAAVAGILDRFFERFFQGFGGDFALSEMEGDVEFWVFQTVEELQVHFKKKHHKDLYNSGGYYDPSNRVIAIPWASHRALLVESVLHEGTHLIFDQFSGASSPQWSPWFSEGLACYFGSSRVQGSEIRLGGYDPYFLKLFLEKRRSGEGVTLRDLLEAPYRFFLEGGNALWYGGSQLLAYYLLEGEEGRLRERFFQYYRLERLPGACGIHQFCSVFGENLEVVDSKWRAFLEGLEE